MGLDGNPAVHGPPPFEQPAAGYVATANNRQTRGPVADAITAYWADPFRALRITELLEQAVRGGEKLDAGRVHAMQLDVLDARARRYAGLAVAAASEADLPEMARVLREWAFRADPASRGAALFYPWVETLRDLLRRDLYGEGGGWLPQALVDDVLEQRRVPWHAGREAGVRFRTLAAEAAALALQVGEGRTLGGLQSVQAEHPLGTVGVLDRVFGFDVQAPWHGGSPATVNVSRWGGGPFPKTTTYGPSQRHVVDLGDVDGDGGFILPTGQSGVPFSRHYRDQFPLWRVGGLWRIPLDSAAAERGMVHRLRLVPEPVHQP